MFLTKPALLTHTLLHIMLEVLKTLGKPSDGRKHIAQTMTPPGSARRGPRSTYSDMGDAYMAVGEGFKSFISRPTNIHEFYGIAYMQHKLAPER